ncbi:MAG: AtpZ/AtpI family protein [Planctomycetes bacterium]|nr:AtpZ/AtpI family protein [Planctomycetota bacterium]
MAEPRPFLALARGFAVASALGTGFAAAVVIGVLAGRAIDRALGWRPIAFTVALGLFGGVAGGAVVIQTLRSMERGSSGKNSTERGTMGRGDGRGTGA